MRSARAAARWAPASSARSSLDGGTEYGSMRDAIFLACDECKRRNYRASRNKKLKTEKLEQKKYCPFCRGHRVHKETKV